MLRLAYLRHSLLLEPIDGRSSDDRTAMLYSWYLAPYAPLMMVHNVFPPILTKTQLTLKLISAANYMTGTGMRVVTCSMQTQQQHVLRELQCSCKCS